MNLLKWSLWKKNKINKLSFPFQPKPAHLTTSFFSFLRGPIGPVSPSELAQPASPLHPSLCLTDLQGPARQLLLLPPAPHLPMPEHHWPSTSLRLHVSSSPPPAHHQGSVEPFLHPSPPLFLRLLTAAITSAINGRPPCTSLPRPTKGAPEPPIPLLYCRCLPPSLLRDTLSSRVCR